jgi:uncharacterized protein YecT (DUF1311 family)
MKSTPVVIALLFAFCAPCLAADCGTSVEKAKLKNMDAACVEIMQTDIQAYADKARDKDNDLSAMVDAQEKWLSCQDKYFNMVYKEVKSGLKKEQASHLTLSEKKWLNVRSDTCEIAEQIVEGTIWANAAANNCVAQMTAERINDLYLLKTK